MPVFTAIGAALFGAGTFLAGATAFGLQVAAGLGLNFLASKIAGKGKQGTAIDRGPGFAVQGKLTAGGAIGRSFLMGTAATAGSLVYANAWGADGESPNAYLTQVICLSDLPVDELTEVWVNGELVTLGGSPHADYGYPVTEYNKAPSRGGAARDHLWVKFYDGTQTTADAFLTGTVSTAERPYESTRVGTGCAYVIVTALVHDTLFTGFPQFKFAVTGVKLYDPSKDSTVGGDGAHRWNSPETWGGDGDHLPAVQIYNLLRGMTYGGTWFYGLQSLPAARLPVAHWIEQIEACRDTVTGEDGSEATYRSGGEIAIANEAASTIEALLMAGSARWGEIGGQYKPTFGVPGSSIASFSDSDIISTEEQTAHPFFALSETVNGISCTYPDPEDGWNVKTAPPLFNADYEDEDGGRRLMSDVALDLVPYRAQVQRLMSSALEEARKARRHTLTLPPSFWALEPNDIVTFTSTRNGYTAKLFRVLAVGDQPNLDVLVDLVEVDPADYDWDHGTDFVPLTLAPKVVVRPPAQAIVDWAVSASYVPDSDDNPRGPALLLEWDGDQDDIIAVEFQVRVQATQAAVHSGRIDNYAAGAALISQGIISSTQYQARGRYIAASDRDTSWSSWLSATTGAFGISEDDFSGEFQARIRQIEKQIPKSLAELQRQIDDLSAATNSHMTSLREHIAQSGIVAGQQHTNASARITEFAAVATTNEQAIAALGTLLTTEYATNESLSAASIETLSSAVSTSNTALAAFVQSLMATTEAGTAESRVRFIASSTPDGALASFSIQVRAGLSEDSWKTSGLYIDIMSDINGESFSRIRLVFDQLVLQDPDDPDNVVSIVVEGGFLKIANNVVPDIMVFTTVGTHEFTIPNFNTLRVRVYGAAGPGGGTTSLNAIQNGSNGGYSAFDDGGAFEVQANGGNATTGAGFFFSGPSPGTGGTATGGDTNTTGETGGVAGLGYGGANLGPDGGARKAGPGTQGLAAAGGAGNSYGGGGAGASKWVDFGGGVWQIRQAPGGGAGGYAERTWVSPAGPTPATVVDVVVGTGGAAASTFVNGGNGANGAVVIEWE